MKKIILLIVMVACSSTLFAQHLITGTVTDRSTGTPVAFGTVAIQNSNIGTITSVDGKFRLAVPADRLGSRLIFSSVGYQADTISITTAKNFYQVSLKPTSGNLGEVVVTGVSRATLARENPIPVVGISAKQIQQTTESNVIDVLVKNVPGLNAVKTGPNISKPFIRGLGYNRVLTLYDGIRQEGQQWGDEHGLEVDAYNIERAEVVKGPSSLIYGSDAVAGVVGLIPAMPLVTDGRVHGQYLSEYQHNNGLIGNGARLLYANAHWAYAVRGSYRIARNYTNPVDGRVYNTGFRESNASASVRYTGNTGNTSLNLTLYDNLQGIPDGSRNLLTRQFTYQNAEGSDDDVLNRPVVPTDVLNSYVLSPLHQHIQHYRVYSKFNYRVGAGNVDGLLGLQQNIRREYNHPTDPDQAGMYVRLNTLNYGVNYHAPVIWNTEFSFGANGMYQANKSKDATDFPIPDYSLFDAGAYAFAKWKHNNLTIGGGLRYDHRSLSGNNFYTRTNPTTGFDEHVNNADGAYLQFPALQKTFRGLSLSMGATYTLSDQVSLKANIARGYRAPSITELASNGLDPGAHIVYLGNRAFGPEFSLQEDVGIEAGSKNYAFTFSVFNNHISNYIFLAQVLDASGNAIVDAQGNKTYQYRQSKAQLYGLEATLNLKPSALPGLSFENAVSVTYGFNRGEEYSGKGAQGEYLPLIPPLRWLSGLSQQLGKWNFRVEADFNAAQHRYLALNNTETFTNGYTLFNAAAGVKVKQVQLQLQVNNVFDKAYQSGLNRLKYFEYDAGWPANRSGIFNMGRNVCLKAIIPF